MTGPRPDVLYHWTCAHMAPGIERDGVLWPRPQPMIRVPLVWLTDMEVPDRAALGLTSHHLPCDRLAYRVTVADPGQMERAVWWPAWARQLPLDVREEYEGCQAGLRPVHWWVAELPVTVSKVDER